MQQFDALKIIPWIFSSSASPQSHPLSGGQEATIVIDIQVAFVDQQGAVTSSSQQATQMMN